MIYSESPNLSQKSYKTTRSKFITVISPDKILLNEKLMLGLMFTAVAAVLVAWAVRKGE